MPALQGNWMLLQLTLSMFIMYGTQDLYRAYFEPVIAQRAGDIPAGSPERMVLVDVEFHSARVMQYLKLSKKFANSWTLSLKNILDYRPTAKPPDIVL